MNSGGHAAVSALLCSLALAERYPGHKSLIDWGRSFVEQHVIPNIIERNEAWKKEGRPERTCFFWVHRDAPEAVKEGLRLLMYTGIVARLDSGVIATRREIGTRYAVIPTHLIHRPARDIFPRLGGTRVFSYCN
jgi:hypothetical protein